MGQPPRALSRITETWFLRILFKHSVAEHRQHSANLLPTDWATHRTAKPLVHTVSVEEVQARQTANRVVNFEVAEADLAVQLLVGLHRLQIDCR